jgi:acyl-CoA thioester hydrolase
LIHELRVRYGECDPQGIVFNANYLAWFDIAMTELYREALGGWDKLTEAGYEAVVAEATLRFKAPAKFDDVVELHVSITNLGTTSMTAGVEIKRDGELLVEGELRHVFLSKETWEKVPIPEWVRSALAT